MRSPSCKLPFKFQSVLDWNLLLCGHWCQKIWPIMQDTKQEKNWCNSHINSINWYGYKSGQTFCSILEPLTVNDLPFGPSFGRSNSVWDDIPYHLGFFQKYLNSFKNIVKAELAICVKLTGSTIKKKNHRQNTLQLTRNHGITWELTEFSICYWGRLLLGGHLALGKKHSLSY